LLKRRKEMKIKKRRNIWEESFFQRKQRARITTTVFAFLANERRKHGAFAAGPTRGREIFEKSSLRLWPTGSAPCFFFANPIKRPQILRHSYDSNPLLQTTSNVP
jgi:hypothetical protein